MIQLLSQMFEVGDGNGIGEGGWFDARQVNCFASS